MNTPNLQKIAFVGDYLPRKCGIATFTHDLRGAIAKSCDAECIVVPMDDLAGPYAYENEVQFQVVEQDIEDYRAAADFLNFNNVDIVCLQHEFGIYGGSAGSHILAMLHDLRMPVVTTLHTVLSEPSQAQRDVMTQLIRLSTRLVVMTERSRQTLINTYSVDSAQVDLIAHGIPTAPDTDPRVLKEQFNVEDKAVALTFGLLSPGKGIEHVLQALPEIVAHFPEFIYLVLGATHPSLIREQGERYRISLERMAKELGVTKHVSFYNRFVELEELTEFIGAADLYITPYLNVQQAVSGTLAYAFGCGQAVISTPYWHAEELLADGRGVLVPFADSSAIAREVIGLLGDDSRRMAMRAQAHKLGRSMTWDHVSRSYLGSFRRALEERSSQRKPLAVRTLDEQPLALPKMQLGHLEHLSDSTGIVQHAIYTVPDHAHGYCTDDNARALILTVLLEEQGKDSPVVHSLASRYAAFLNLAFDRDTGRFRNFMSFDRRWLEDDGSDDSQGRALWALGTCIGRSHRAGLAGWARSLFQQAMPACDMTTSPRTWALGIMGIQEYLRRYSGDRAAATMSQRLADRLLEMYEATATEDWPWFEDIATYNNARLSQSLIAHGFWTRDQRATDIGLTSLRWLCEKQLSPEGRFRPIGSNGFSREGGVAAVFDQQAIEAHAMVSSSIEAYAATKDPFWNEQAHLAFDWFLGRNDLGQPIYDASTGGCFDGLMANQVNENQGAESTLAFLLSLVEMRSLKRNDASHLNFHLDGLHVQIKRTGIVLSPNKHRVVLRPFQPPGDDRVLRVIARVCTLSENDVDDQLTRVLDEFHGRHQQPKVFFQTRFHELRHHLLTDAPLSENRQLLLGAYFTQEYALESAALFNPSLVPHPDQSGLPQGSRRFAMSLRAVGEGHISSIVFRSGTISRDLQITIDEPVRFVTTPRYVPDSSYDNDLFRRKLIELRLGNPFTYAVLVELPAVFTLDQLETQLRTSLREHRTQHDELAPIVEQVIMLAKSNYEIQYTPDHDLSERLVFPFSPTETNGIEDARFVLFQDDDGRRRYYATYSAYDGRMVLPQLLETEDFLRFKMHTLNGPAVSNKGMALFPRKINGHFAMLGRQDGEHLYLMYSDMLYFWHTSELIIKPTNPWEYVQMGNCGSPIETDAGWLVLTHGVGAMRKYCIGAILLDLDDPSKIIARLHEPLITPNEVEREGYVPNVVYSCGALLHKNHLVIPYAMSDYATTFATIELKELLSSMS